MYSTHNKENPERFIRTLEIQFTSIWMQYQKMCIFDKLDDKFNKYNNTYHSTIKVKLVDVKLSTYIDSRKRINNKDPI